MRAAPLIAVLACVALASAAAPGPGHLLVVCAPGYPGSTEGAQAAMDDLAAALASGAGWPLQRLRAAYDPTEGGGLARLASREASAALVPLPFYLEHGDSLGLEPRLAVARGGGPAQRWSLVARRGAVSRPGDLAGRAIASIAGYSPRFVTRVALRGFGAVPETASVRFTGRLLPEIREAAAGGDVVLLLDGGQAESLAALPAAAELETVARSEPLLEALLCTRRGRMTAADERALVASALALAGDAASRELLSVLRMERFVELDRDALAASERAFAGDAGSAGR